MGHDQADDGDQGDDQDWTEQLLRIVRQIEPDAFERLCQQVLSESGFTKVEVTGRSGDGGIDGAGVLRVNLLSFHVRFQSKRYTGSEGAPEMHLPKHELYLLHQTGHSSRASNAISGTSTERPRKSWACPHILKFRGSWLAIKQSFRTSFIRSVW